jgi:hypothetical protein
MERRPAQPPSSEPDRRAPIDGTRRKAGLDPSERRSRPSRNAVLSPGPLGADSLRVIWVS